MVYSQWVQDGGKWYYIDANGYMVTGTQKINGKTYKFNSNGVWIV
jgi:lactocepin